MKWLFVLVCQLSLLINESSGQSFLFKNDYIDWADVRKYYARTTDPFSDCMFKYTVIKHLNGESDTALFEKYNSYGQIQFCRETNQVGLLTCESWPQYPDTFICNQFI